MDDASDESSTASKSESVLTKEGNLYVANLKNGAVVNRGSQFEINRFYRRKQEGTIDVWWLFDDGGKSDTKPTFLFVSQNTY